MPPGVFRYLEVPWSVCSASRCLQVASDAFRCLQGPQGASRYLQVLLGNFRCLQVPLGNFWCLQMPSGALKCLQVPSGAFRSFHGREISNQYQRWLFWNTFNQSILWPNWVAYRKRKRLGLKNSIPVHAHFLLCIAPYYTLLSHSKALKCLC